MTPPQQTPPVGLAPCGVTLPRRTLGEMFRLARRLHRLQRHPDYLAAATALLPAVVGFDPGQQALLAGYDFHVDARGAQLIEVNANAGGAFLAARAMAGFPTWPQLARERLEGRLRRAFVHEWKAFRRHARVGEAGGDDTLPRRAVILDEDPRGQFLFPEMEYFRDLFRRWGVTTEIVAPAELVMEAGGVWLEGERIDLIYNRHCDFFLESPPLQGLRSAYLAGRVCLTPNPRGHGILGDKRLLVLWSDEGALRRLGVPPALAAAIAARVPESRILAEVEPERLWRERNQWIFKPVNGYGGRGVIHGRGLSRVRLARMEPGETLVQRLVPPSTIVPPGETAPMKMDFRLFVHDNTLFGVAARLYRGQVTNFRQPGNGFAPVRPL
ncbi:MAG: hypothetical protein HQL57_09325 [Magnetococcales bacterium]|nr:hypothetical protein [Magnetococcales bacterium]